MSQLPNNAPPAPTRSPEEEAVRREVIQAESVEQDTESIHELPQIFQGVVDLFQVEDKGDGYIHLYYAPRLKDAAGLENPAGKYAFHVVLPALVANRLRAQLFEAQQNQNPKQRAKTIAHLRTVGATDHRPEPYDMSREPPPQYLPGQEPPLSLGEKVREAAAEVLGKLVEKVRGT